ncbi:acyl carrier protein [Micromonospora cathayae]|uniref:Phosphopantetheine-binding protein n=1 Tax=Micromonospora cathayae TaxID=3028804 RepID=A0ABY7ZNR5_9ACTN|nr:phosphopantetheine-binding protein [Micromonospora sp. HUAS 3]WDZ84665.1 phosphopantetheine-binding protein [Micromonospora sp. HUAS 3]
MIGLDEHVRTLVDDLVAVKPTLRPEDVRTESSITRDLGFDSLDLVELAARIRDNHPDFDLLRWLEDAMSSEVDSVGSMAELLARSGTAQEEKR